MKVPKNKTDFEALEGITKEEVIRYQDLLLEWLEDINWPVSSAVITVLSPHISDIENGILKVLKSSDTEWACNIILHLLTSVDKLPPSIIHEVKCIYNKPLELEELKEACEVLFEKIGINY